MSHADENAIAPLAMVYYEWLSGNGGAPPDALLKRALSPRQRELLLERMNTVNMAYAITAPIRQATRLRETDSRAQDD